jgi:hypothetical protein
MLRYTHTHKDQILKTLFNNKQIQPNSKRCVFMNKEKTFMIKELGDKQKYEYDQRPTDQRAYEHA